jgi:hypothetical protein
MKSLLFLSLLLSAPGFAAGLSCTELKDRITNKLEGKGVKNYTLEVVEQDQPTKLRVVGSCDRGSSKIIYHGGRKQGDSLSKVVKDEAP